ncbi:hypothetical protein A2U01_0061567, partial [Trifolium medium]|nr:hypothetical protein [Trifolium medium]
IGRGSKVSPPAADRERTKHNKKRRRSPAQKQWSLVDRGYVAV